MAIPILRTLDGAEIPAGKVARRPLIGPDLGAAALPSWLAAINGTATFPASPDTWGVQLATGTAAGAQATLGTAFSLTSTRFRQIRWTIDTWCFDAATAGATASISIREVGSSPTAGVSLFGILNAGAATCRIYNPAGNVSVDLGYSWAGAEAPRWRSLTLDLRPIDRRLYIWEGDQVIEGGAFDLAASFNDGALVPQVNLTNSAGGAARWWRAAQVRLDVVHN
jgi:hypothetical protein